MGCHMDDEQKAWYRQFSSNFGPREYMRFSGVFIAWMCLGLILAIVLGSSTIIMPFLLGAFLFAAMARYSRTTYRALRFILGNPNLPPEPMPRAKDKQPHEPRAWWSFIPGIWFWILSLAVFYLAIRYFLR